MRSNFPSFLVFVSDATLPLRISSIQANFVSPEKSIPFWIFDTVSVKVLRFSPIRASVIFAIIGASLSTAFIASQVEEYPGMTFSGIKALIVL